MRLPRPFGPRNDPAPNYPCQRNAGAGGKDLFGTGQARDDGGVAIPCYSA